MKKVYQRQTRMLLSLLLSSLGLLLNGQTTLEVQYYKPLEAAGGGYLESNSMFLLQCNARQSLFISTSSENIDSYYSDDNNQTYALKVWLGDGEAWIYKDFAKMTVLQYAMSIQENRFLINDEVHPMPWEITDEIKQINGMSVQKARAEHRGRMYTAWFAPSIPLNNGPWKLGGLPGLILEAYDDEKEVVFLFKSLRQIPDQTIERPSSKGRKVSLETFLALSEKEFRQYLDFMEAKLKNVSSNVDINLNLDSYTTWESLK